MRVEHEYERGGALAYLAALDVHRGTVFGRCEGSTGIFPFAHLVGLRAYPLVNERRGKLRRCTDLAAAFATVRSLICEARTRYRWDTRPQPRAIGWSVSGVCELGICGVSGLCGGGKSG